MVKDWTVELGYVGTTGVNLERIDDINRKVGDLLDGTVNRINSNFDTLLFVTNGTIALQLGISITRLSEVFIVSPSSTTKGPQPWPAG